MREASKDLEGYLARRELEDDIAFYLESHGIYYDLAQKLRACRRSGALGVRQDRKGEIERVIAWDSKCGQTRLCPDEAREEQMRLAERYVPVIEKWKNEKRGRQVQYCVLTWPNIEPGRLEWAKREMYKQLSAWLKRKPCESVKGALCVQEDPLSSSGDWNVHINLVLLVDGRFDWGSARADWYKHTRALFASHEGAQAAFGGDFQVHFQDVTKGNLVKAVLELVKYAAKHVTGGRRAAYGGPGSVEASSGGQGERAPAPGLLEWPPERFSEWWEAGLGFRRTRSYGELFKVKKPKPEPLEGVEWVGRVTFDHEAGAYRVRVGGFIDLIPGHNSGNRGAGESTSSGPEPPGGVGPPSSAQFH